MPAAEPLSVLATGAAERAFANESFVRRLAKVAQLEADSRVLQLGVGDGSMGLLLAQTLRCRVTVVAEDGARLKDVAQRASALSLGERLQTREASLESLTDKDFTAVLVTGSLGLGFSEGAKRLRKHVGKDGRVCQVYPVRVGLGAASEEWAKGWHDRLGEPLLSPVELLGVLEAAGFEPETVETLSESELEAALRVTPPPSSETALYQAPQSAPRATLAVAVGRRKETGEKPPVSGDRG